MSRSAEVLKYLGNLFRRNRQQHTMVATPSEPLIVPDPNLPFDERWATVEPLSPEERRRFLVSEVSSVISRFKEGATSQEAEFAESNFVFLNLDPSELEQSQLPSEVKDYLLDHFNDPAINKYRRLPGNVGPIELWSEPEIVLTVEPNNINLKTVREIPNWTYLGYSAPRGRTVYLGMPRAETNYSLAVGIKSDFTPHMQRRVDNQMKTYVSTNKWLVAKELTRFAMDAVISRRQPAHSNH